MGKLFYSYDVLFEIFKDKYTVFTVNFNEVPYVIIFILLAFIIMKHFIQCNKSKLSPVILDAFNNLDYYYFKSTFFFFLKKLPVNITHFVWEMSCFT